MNAALHAVLVCSERRIWAVADGMGGHQAGEVASAMVIEALSCIPEDSPPAKVPGNLKTDYIPLAPKDLAQIVLRLGNNWPLPEELKDPSPVAGIQRKIALVAIGNEFAIPVPGSGAPTTHILKVPGPGLTREAFYEAWCSSLAPSPTWAG